MSDLRHRRVNGPFEYTHESQVIQGQRGLTTAGTLTFPTIERLVDGELFLPSGDYACIMSNAKSAKTGRLFHVIRLVLSNEQYQSIYPPKRASELIAKLGSQALRRIMYHAANWPHQLDGCIAPGLEEIVNGVGKSGAALDLLFQALGGYELGKQLTLTVE